MSRRRKCLPQQAGRSDCITGNGPVARASGLFFPPASGRLTWQNAAYTFAGIAWPLPWIVRSVLAIDWAAVLNEALGDVAVAALPPTMSLPALPLAVTQFVQKSNHPKAAI